MPVLINGTTGLTFNDGSVLSSVTSTVPAAGAVGSILRVGVNTTSNVLAGSSVAGSILYSPNVITSQSSISLTYSHDASTSDNSRWGTSGSVSRVTVGNTGFVTPLGSTTLSGTWRLLEPCSIRFSAYDGYVNETTSYMCFIYAVRIV